MRVISGLLAAAALAVVVAGCGQTGAAGSADSAVPESALAYVSVDTSFEGDQWRAVAGLLEEFPDGEGLLEDLLEKATAEAGLEGDVELRDVLGPEVALVVLDVPRRRREEAPVVVLTKPDDEDAFAAAPGGRGRSPRRGERLAGGGRDGRRPGAVPRGARGGLARGLGRLRGGDGRPSRGGARTRLRERRRARRGTGRSVRAAAGRRGRIARRRGRRRGRRRPRRGPCGRGRRGRSAAARDLLVRAGRGGPGRRGRVPLLQRPWSRTRAVPGGTRRRRPRSSRSTRRR